MAEALGVAAGALGLLGVVDASMNIGGKILSYIHSFRDTKNEHQRLRMELTVLQAILPLVKEKLEEPNNRAASALECTIEASGVKNVMYLYEQSLERIKMELEKMTPGLTKAVQPSANQPSLAGTKRSIKKVLNSVSKTSWPHGSLSASSSSMPPPHSPRLCQRLAWPSALKDIREDLSRIERFKMCLMLLLVAGAPAAKQALF